MKKFYIFLCLAIAALTQLQAQAPQGFNYQATVRNSAGDLIINTNVYFKFNVIQGSLTAVPIFTETHYVSTDDLGQVNLVIGQGTANLGAFSALDWSLGSYYLGIELNTGNGYLAMGTTQLLSVPYALYAENSGNATSATPNLEAVLAENNSANNQQIKDLQDPTEAQDAVTLAYVLQLESQIEEINLNIDHDGDGFTENQGDCNDAYALINPAAIELEDDGIDNNCNGQIDEVADQNEIDNDNDGFTENQGDCDDSNSNINPNSLEIQDGLDNNCDGSIDEIPLEELDGLNNLLFQIESGEVQLITIGELKAMYDSDPDGDGDNNDAMPFRVDTDIVVKGYVTSSDLTGNFYKEVYLQDSPDNPTDAIKVILSQVDSYNRFNKGREVYIKLYPTYSDGATGGLYIGEERTGNEVITIGGGTNSNQYGTTVTSLTQNQMNATMLRSEITEEIVPLNVQFSQISSAHIGVFVQIDNVEFEGNLDGLRYFDPSEDYYTQRTLQSCSGFNYSNMNIETSSLSNFKNEILPTGNGSIGGIVVKTYDGSSLVLSLNTTDDVNFSGARCELLNVEDFNILFEEDFEAYSNFDQISGDWTNYIEEGTIDWIARTTTDTGNPGSRIAQISAYNSGDISTVSWLITPGIDLDAQEFEFFDFESSNSFSDGSELELLISTDWDGTDAGVSSATWTSLPGTIVPDDTYYTDWVYSGLVDLSPYSGTAHIAFKYIANSGNTGTYEIDNVKVLVQN